MVAGAVRVRACFSQKQMWVIFALQEKHVDTKLAKIKREWADRGGSQEGHINSLFSEW